MNVTSHPRAADALREACRRAGNQTKLAEKLGRKKAAVSRWLAQQVPAEVCPEIELLTGVKCEDLRPDVNWAVLRDSSTTSEKAT
jgi:DNA-binding transcriptional regulator YdaS (Cro superfamily)